MGLSLLWSVAGLGAGRGGAGMSSLESSLPPVSTWSPDSWTWVSASLVGGGSSCGEAMTGFVMSGGMDSALPVHSLCSQSVVEEVKYVER